MNNIEKKLNNIRVKSISKDEKDSLWHSVSVRKIESNRNSEKLLLNIYKFKMKKLIVGFIALVVILGGGGVVSASNNSVPGDLLFPIDLALEKIQVKLSSNDKKEELKFRFAEERMSEIKEVSSQRSTQATSLVADLSSTTSLGVEVDVFTNETVVKIESNNKKYGYISSLKNKEEIIKEISSKYSISESKVSAVVDFEVEDRSSRPEDKQFLNKTNSINFSEDESRDVSKALSEIELFLNEGTSNTEKEELKKSLAQILILLGDEGKLELKRDGSEIKIETKDGEVKVEMESKLKKGSSKDSDDDSSDKSDDDDSDDSDKSAISSDIKEDDSEVFCRGEWRDEDDCNEDDDSDDDNDSDDDDEEEDEDDNSGSGKNRGSDDN